MMTTYCGNHFGMGMVFGDVLGWFSSYWGKFYFSSFLNIFSTKSSCDL